MKRKKRSWKSTEKEEIGGFMDALLCVCVWFRITCVSEGWGEMERKSILATPIVVDKFFVCDFFSLILSPSLSRKESVTRRKSFFFLSFQEPRLNFTFFLSFLFIFILTFFFTGGCHFLSLGDGIIGAYSLLLLLTLGPVAMVALFDGNVLLLLLDFIRFDGPTI
jgi:hypothetical protein